MVLHPDPSRPDFKQSQMEAMNNEVANAMNVLSEEERKELAQTKAQKKALLSKFVQDNGIHADDLTRVFSKYQTLNKPADVGITMDEFCTLFSVEPTGEYKRLFSFFARDEKDGVFEMDIKEFLLGKLFKKNE